VPCVNWSNKTTQLSDEITFLISFLENLWLRLRFVKTCRQSVAIDIDEEL
jgi:hypothetical protein